jgi:glycosyltransferase involved in cell wall biosynthesis
VAVQELLPDRYVRRLYSESKRGRSEIASAYWRRLRHLLKRDRPRTIWLEKELWPYVPGEFELLALARVPFVVDIDDAVFHTYDESGSPLIRWALGRKIDRIFRRASLVTAGSSYLLRRANQAGARRAELIPTVVDLEQYSPCGHRDRGFTVGWIGSPATQSYVESITPVLSELLRDPGCRLVTIGTRYPNNLHEHHEQREWSQSTEAHQIEQLDVGIMPLPDGPFERGKCGYKLIQYMACGLPVVASPVGANTEIVRHGENGFLAESPEQWRSALSALKHDKELRRRMGAAGRLDVERKYSIQVTGPLVAQWLKEIGASSVLSGAPN